MQIFSKRVSQLKVLMLQIKNRQGQVNNINWLSSQVIKIWNRSFQKLILPIKYLLKLLSQVLPLVTINMSNGLRHKLILMKRYSKKSKWLQSRHLPWNQSHKLKSHKKLLWLRKKKRMKQKMKMKKTLLMINKNEFVNI